MRLFRSFFRQGPAAAEVIALVQLEEKRDARVGNLSGGQKQRLALACALVGDPAPAVSRRAHHRPGSPGAPPGLGPDRAIPPAGRTILLTTHYMDEAEKLCDRVAIMDHGKVIAQGTPRELIASIGVEHMVEFSAANGAAGGHGAFWSVWKACARCNPKMARCDAGHRIAPRRARPAG